MSFMLLVFCMHSCTEGSLILPHDEIQAPPETPQIVDQAQMSQLQFEMIEATNAVRTKGCNCNGIAMPAVEAIFWHPMLEEAATLHAKDMFNNDYFNHESLDGRSFMDRIAETGYDGRYRGENMAKGPTTAQVAVNAFVESESHCKVLMNANYTEMGTGKVGAYWVVNFGSR